MDLICGKRLTKIKFKINLWYRKLENHASHVGYPEIIFTLGTSFRYLL